MIQPLVSVRDVFCLHRSAEGDVAALQGASLRLDRGEGVCVLGPSGAGKTTLLRVIAGLQTPAAGDVMIGGHDIGRMGPRARARLRHDVIGFVPQRAEIALAPELTVRQAIELPLALRGASRRERRRRADELLEATGLSRRAAARPQELSGGEAQRVAVCAAVAHRPELLLADEPTAELDAAAARSVLGTIGALTGADGCSAIVVSHDATAAALMPRTVHISDGRIAQERRGDEEALVVGRGGWVQLPEALRQQAGVGNRVRVHAEPGRIVLTGAGGEDEGTWDLPARPPAPAEAPAGAAPGATVNGAPGADSSDGGLAVVVEGVTRELGRGARRRRVLEGLSLTLPAGVLTVVTGPSGTGKTTLLRLLAGLDRADVGTIAVGPARLEQLGPEALAALCRRHIGYLPQDPAPVGFLTSAENVVLSLRLRGWSRSEAEPRASGVLAQLGMTERARQRTERLSAGEAQRVALARAVAAARGLLIVDEPTSRLDRARARLVAELLVTVATRDAQTVVCATHDPDIVARAGQVIEL